MASLKTSALTKAILASLALMGRPGLAEVTLDGSMGPAVSLPGPNYQIPQSYGRTAGGNLFHSFGAFTIGLGQSATFYGPPSIDNVIARVTGVTGSTIDGLLTSAVPSANLWLINPSGVLFGPHASVNVDGSFYVSTANYLKFADGSVLDATRTPAPILTTSAPEAFGFLGPNPAPIGFQGSGSAQARNYLGAYYAAQRLAWNDMKVPEGKTFAVVGGDIQIKDGQLGNGTPVASVLQAPAGRIELVSVAGQGEINPNAQPVDTGLFAREGNISIRSATPQGALVDATGPGGGEIVIRGGALTLQNAYLVSDTTGQPDGKGVNVNLRGDLDAGGNGAGIYASTSGTGKGGDITVQADNIKLADTAVFFSGTNGTGTAGSMNIIAKGKLSIESGSMVSSATLFGSSGNGGDISISANELDISDVSSVVTEKGMFSTGNGGWIEIKAGNVNLHQNSQIGSYTGEISEGKGGSVSIASGDMTLSGKSSVKSATGLYGPAVGGTLEIVANGKLSVESGSTISSTTIDAGNGGDIHISAEEVDISDSSSITSEKGVFSSGKGGEIKINAETTNLQKNSQIGSYIGYFSEGEGGAIHIASGDMGITGGSVVQSASGRYGTARGGAVSIDVGRNLTIKDRTSTGSSGIFSNAADGDAGKLTIQANHLMMENGATVGVDNFASGRGADLDITVKNLTLRSDPSNPASFALISAKPFALLGLPTGSPGNIAIKADAIQFSGPRSGITTALFGNADAGRVSIDAKSLEMTDRARIEGLALLGKGRASDFFLKVDRLALQGGSTINSSSQSDGAAGNINVQAGSVDIQGSPDARAGIYSTASGKGDAGHITVAAADVNVLDYGEISTSTLGGGRSGDIELNASGNVALAGPGGISSKTLGIVGNAPAGTITVTAGRLSLSRGAGIAASTAGGGKAGNVTLSARQVSLDDGAITTQTLGTGPAGTISIHAGEVDVARNSHISSDNFIDNPTITATGRGNAGAIGIQADRTLRVADASRISTATAGEGSAGTVSLEAGQSISVSNLSQITSSSGYTAPTGTAAGQIGEKGQAGNVTLQAGEITVSDGASIGAETGDGKGGKVEIRAGTLRLERGGIISSSTYGLGNAGNVAVHGIDEPAAKLVSINGLKDDLSFDLPDRHPVSGQFSGIYLNTAGSGQGGSLDMKTDRLALQDGGLISAVTAFGAMPGTRGGDITIQAGSVQLTGGGLISAATSGAGKAGNVNLAATGPVIISGQFNPASHPALTNPRISDHSGINNSASFKLDGRTQTLGSGGSISLKAGSLSLADGGEISVANEGTGSGSVGGSISIDAGERFYSENGRISAETASAQGGDITLSARQMVRLAGSRISTSVAGGQGSGGNIFIDSRFVILDHSQIIAQALQGAGGDIHIVAGQFIQSGDSIVDASSRFGLAGTVLISAPDSNIIGKVSTLTAKFLDPASLFKEQCAARYAAGFSTLAVQTAEAVGPAPGEGFLIAPYPDSANEIFPAPPPCPGTGL